MRYGVHTTFDLEGLLSGCCDLDLQKAIRPLVGASEYSLSVVQSVQFMRYRVNNMIVRLSVRPVRY